MGLLDGIVGALLGNLPGAARQAPGTGGTDGGNSVLTALLPIVLGMLMNRQGGAATGAEGGGGLSDVLGGMLGGARGSQGGGPGDVLGGILGGAGGTLGAVLGSVLGGGANGASGAGGLGSLLEQFQRAGFAEQANSWVGTGQNLPLPPGAIGQVFGSDTLAQIAQQVGVTEAEAAEGLSQLLPEVVDRFTPEGKAPDLDQLAASVTALTRQFGG
ncbi:MAG: DUF937 domain-containing protein [Candidatus Accumulibacter sp.]|jgi:uncharacterized protein YidB (DUF937 family)|nr:DUF937 domain-containing protein [Candidatus Accumulibacter necessarius]